MAVPEATVDEDDRAVLGEDNIRGTGEALDVHTVAESEAPEGMTQLSFRLCGSGMNDSHSSGSDIWRFRVGRHSHSIIYAKIRL